MDIYQENIMDHYKNPRNFGDVENADQTVQSTNASCGDMVRFTFKFEGGKIVEVKQKCMGCAISTASSSLVSEILVGKTVEEARGIGSDKVMELLGIEITPSRLKCALLPLDALKDLKE